MRLSTFRELILEAENLKRINCNQLQLHVSGEESVQDSTERNQKFLLGFDLILVGKLRWIIAFREGRFLRRKLSSNCHFDSFQLMIWKIYSFYMQT